MKPMQLQILRNVNHIVFGRQVYRKGIAHMYDCTSDDCITHVVTYIIHNHIVDHNITRIADFALVYYQMWLAAPRQKSNLQIAMTRQRIMFENCSKPVSRVSSHHSVTESGREQLHASGCATKMRVHCFQFYTLHTKFSVVFPHWNISTIIRHTTLSKV